MAIVIIGEVQSFIELTIGLSLKWRTITSELEIPLEREVYPRSLGQGVQFSSKINGLVDV
jgi:hypothetical protein